ncbi:hypothetical protein TUM12370_15240 [Salmonella enterica subsp. enterica serovar Choleraesuis]|nr:hypothetical protein TUM12370_15240 [Salmonella enterica subsp. enterica serovar Choleraesuis]
MPHLNRTVPRLTQRVITHNVNYGKPFLNASGSAAQILHVVTLTGTLGRDNREFHLHNPDGNQGINAGKQ